MKICRSGDHYYVELSPTNAFTHDAKTGVTRDYSRDGLAQLVLGGSPELPRGSELPQSLQHAIVTAGQRAEEASQLAREQVAEILQYSEHFRRILADHKQRKDAAEHQEGQPCGSTHSKEKGT